MKTRAFVLPNLTVTLRYYGSCGDVEAVLYGPDSESVSQRLRRHYTGIEVRASVAYDFAKDWGSKALRKKMEAEQAILKGLAFDFSANAIWTELKDFLFDLFDQTCAYCESPLKAVDYGSVEHYRPKAPVHREAGHRGYYWLAFDATNYLPTCKCCNTRKGTKFPLAAGCRRACCEGEEAQERPLLLNPYHDRCEEHLAFRIAGGGAAGPLAHGLSRKGKETIDVLGLNRPDLVEARRNEQLSAVVAFLVQRHAQIQPNPILNQLVSGQRPYSAAALAAVLAVDKSFPSVF